MFVLKISRPILNMGNVGSKKGHQVKSKDIFVYTLEATFATWFLWNLVRMLFWQYLGQLRIWVMSGQKVGHQVKSKDIFVYTLEAIFATRFFWNLIRMFVSAISRPSSNIGQVGSTSRSPGQILESLVYTLEATLVTVFFIKLGQNVCFDNIYALLEYESCWVKN